jgi:hypothetical protein
MIIHKQSRVLSLTPARRLVNELLRHARKVPTVPHRIGINIGQLAEVRKNVTPSPPWIVLFTKAFALIAQNRPELRRSYIPWPQPHLYEHPYSICSVLVERTWDHVESLLSAKIRSPEWQSLAALNDHLRHFQSAPMATISDFRQLMRIAKLPAALRRFIFWSTLSLSGAKRAKRFGTFMISSLGKFGVEQVHPIAPVTTYLTFGPIAANGDVTATCVYDHRVMDGGQVARALSELGPTLNGPIRHELNAMTKTSRAA